MTILADHYLYSLRNTKTLFLLLLLCHGRLVFSQADTILALPAEKQLPALWKWYRADVPGLDSLQVMTSLKAAEKLFAEKNKTLLRRQTWLIQQLCHAKRNAPEKSAAIMLEAATIAGNKDWELIQAECWHFAGDFFLRGAMYVPAFEYMQKAKNVFDKYGSEKYPHVLRYEGGIANCYYHFGEYAEAIRYFKETMQLIGTWSSVIYYPDIENTIALCYQQLKQYDSAVIWYNQSYHAAAAVKDSFYMALANGNLGFTYYLQKQYDRALPLLEADYMTSVHANEAGSAAIAALTLVAIYLKKGQLAPAEKYMNLSRQIVYTSGNARLWKIWYENLYELSKIKGEYKNTGRYADSLFFYKDSLAALNDKKSFNQAVLKLETEKHMNEVSQLENKRRQQILLRNSLLAGLVLLAIIALLTVNRQLLKRNKEKELAQQQLQFAGQELANYTQQLKEKNDLLEQLRNEINIENESLERTGNINKLLDTTILTEDDWKKFRQLFEKVYPGFFIRLKEKIPDLSATDTRLLALTKLQLSQKDMAAMLGVSYDAIKKAKQRLRKKISLPEEGGLEELVEMI